MVMASYATEYIANIINPKTLRKVIKRLRINTTLDL